LEYYFFERGEGLGFEELNQFNAARNRHGLGQVEFRETDIGEYARSRDKRMKAERRYQIRDEFTDANAEVLAERLARARAEEKGSPPAHYKYEEFQSWRRQQNASAPLSQEEVDERASTCRPGDMPGVIPIGVRMSLRSKKHEKFGDLAPERLQGVLEAIHKLGNLSSPNYEFEEAEVEKMFDTIRERLEETRGRFWRRFTKRRRFSF
jgi:hypothetical protein